MEDAPKRPFLVTSISKFWPSISKKKLRYRYTILEDAPKRPFLATSISKFFLRYRSQNCDIVIRYRRSISGYTDVEGKFLRCLIRHRIQHRDIRMSKYDLSDVARDMQTCFSAAGSWAHQPCSCGKLEYDSELEIFKLSWKSSSFALFSVYIISVKYSLSLPRVIC